MIAGGSSVPAGRKPVYLPHGRALFHTERMDAVLIRAVPFVDPLAQGLLREWNEELGGWPKGGATVRPSDFAPPNGTFLVASAGGVPLACGGLRLLSPSLGEVKRLFVRASERGRGIGYAVLTRLEDEACRLGLGELRLDTDGGNPAALALFRAAGYTPIDDYNGKPYARFWFAKRLEPPATSPAVSDIAAAQSTPPEGALPYGGAADARTGGMSLADRFRRHADALVRDDRSPLSAALMYGAAADLEQDGVVAQLFSDIPVPPGSVPQLRLLAALHHLVLAGNAPELAEFYPSVGGQSSAGDAWAAARMTISERHAWIRERLERTVQTNEPGRSAVLYAALLWLTDQYEGRSIRLLELGASAGLNLIPDCYCYLVGGQALGDPSSDVRFHEPWPVAPPIDVERAARRMLIRARAGCDRNPLDVRRPEDRLALLSYIWPDESERLERMRLALQIALKAPPAVAAQPASAWLPDALQAREPDELTVVWQSIFRQYVDPGEWAAIEDAVTRASSEDPSRPVEWLAMEPGEDHLARVRLALRGVAVGGERLLAECADHGPPVLWRSSE